MIMSGQEFSNYLLGKPIIASDVEDRLICVLCFSKCDLSLKEEIVLKCTPIFSIHKCSVCKQESGHFDQGTTHWEIR